ncbi:MAG: biotin--[acetyl-CoA-carboxylase] ligase [Saprospiraceae bacterium]|nr:biotin--[acetyl-CoA-carboxylase] ligase [Saprospiraceae bacterium]MCB9324336.1 biotin--[acetyl-CoA-carboxylase] ligase [Lewinellaceae bacterium]
MQKLNTLFIGKVLLAFPQLPSTNVHAIDLLSKSRPIEGTVISTADQTNGRGQIGSKWLSNPFENLTCSVILYPIFLEAKHQFLLNIMTSLAVFDVIQQLLPGKKCAIKWPNDLYVEDKKIAGILIQNSLQGSTIQSTVIGLGINVLQTSFANEIPNATSIKLESTRPNGTGFPCAQPDSPFSVENVLFRFCENLENRYLQLKAGRESSLKDNYLTHLLGLGEERLYQKNDKSYFKGTIRGVTEAGKLIVESSGELLNFNLKEVSFL